MKTPARALCFLLLLALGAPSPLLAAENVAPDAVVRAFLIWYLPVAFDKGAEAVYDKRMDAVIEADLLKTWRKEQKSEGGIGYVPFVGQDFDEGWAKNFKVDPASVTNNTATVKVRYIAPQWSQSLNIQMTRTGDVWMISGFEPLD